MSATVDELERRLSALEVEVAKLREQLELNTGRQPECLGAEMIRRAKESQAALSAAWEEAMRRMGIPKVEPIGAEKLQEMMLAEGIRPEDNIISSEIIRLREQTRG